MNELFFSIIIPTYNRAEFIGKTINSILNQTYQNFEIIVVDDGSTDDTKNLILQINDSRLKYYYKSNGERGAARNFGVSKSNGDYVTFLDSDDLLLENHFEIAKNELCRLNCNVFHIRYFLKDELKNILIEMPFLKGDLREKIIEGNFFSCQGMFLKKAICIKNPFVEDKNLATLEDWELWLRICSENEIYYSNQLTSILVNHNSRSVNNHNALDLIAKINLFLELFLSIESNRSFYKNKINLLKSSCFSYISLHCSENGKNKIISLKFLLKSFFSNHKVIFKRRFYVILRNLMFKF
jgi:glycosyltransferase involved in cell wall biosynthesis